MKKSVIFILILSFVFGCRDLFEKDIQQKQVKVISPVDKAVAEEGETVFLWKPVDSAVEYHLTIVSPSFAKASRVMADTVFRDDSTSVITSYSHMVHLEAGEYQWNIRARNSAYSTRDNILTLLVEPGKTAGDGDDDDKDNPEGEKTTGTE